MKSPTIPALQTSPPDVAGLAAFLKDRFTDLGEVEAKEAISFVDTASIHDALMLIDAVAPAIGAAFTNLVPLGTEPTPDQEGEWLEWQRVHETSLKVVNSLQKRLVVLYDQDPDAFKEETRVEKKSGLTLVLSSDSAEEVSSQKKGSEVGCTS